MNLTHIRNNIIVRYTIPLSLTVGENGSCTVRSAELTATNALDRGRFFDTAYGEKRFTLNYDNFVELNTSFS